MKYLRKINGGVDGTQLQENSSYHLDMINAKPIYLVMYRDSKRQLDNLVQLKIQDTGTFSAIPNSYWWNKYSTADSTLNICWVSNEMQKCLDIDISAGGTYYVSVSLSERYKAIMVELVDDSEGEWDSDLVRKAQFKREKNSDKE